MTWTCSICQKEYDGWGNNPWPYKGERCCDHCNATKVIPARMAKAYGKGKE